VVAPAVAAPLAPTLAPVVAPLAPVVDPEALAPVLDPLAPLAAVTDPVVPDPVEAPVLDPLVPLDPEVVFPQPAAHDREAAMARKAGGRRKVRDRGFVIGEGSKALDRVESGWRGLPAQGRNATTEPAIVQRLGGFSTSYLRLEVKAHGSHRRGNQRLLPRGS